MGCQQVETHASAASLKVDPRAAAPYEFNISKASSLLRKGTECSDASNDTVKAEPDYYASESNYFLSQCTFSEDDTEEEAYVSDVELVDWLEILNTDGHYFEKDCHNYYPAPVPARQVEESRLFEVCNPYAPMTPRFSESSIIQPEMTSLEVFTSFVRLYSDANGNEHLDCSGILSRECYLKWLDTRSVKPTHPEECFRKSIISKLTRSDGGSAPFPEVIEQGLLPILRKRQVWECFRGQRDSVTGKPVMIGSKGLRSLGFHERQALETKKNIALFSCDSVLGKRQYSGNDNVEPCGKRR